MLLTLRISFLAKCCVSGAKDRASLTVASNYSSIVEKLEHIVDCAQQKYTARAYVHWYEKHGLERVCHYLYYN